MTRNELCSMLYLAQFYEPQHNKKLMANRIIAIVEFSATLEYRIAKWKEKKYKQLVEAIAF